MRVETPQFMRLPEDSDGVPIQVGDWLVGAGFRFQVIAVAQDRVYRCDDYGEISYAIAKSCRHYREQTVESVLAEFAGAVIRSGHQWGLDSERVIAKFAEMLRLAQDVDD